MAVTYWETNTHRIRRIGELHTFIYLPPKMRFAKLRRNEIDFDEFIELLISLHAPTMNAWQLATT
jgi:hypothetical protein